MKVFFISFFLLVFSLLGGASGSYLFSEYGEQLFLIKNKRESLQTKNIEDNTTQTSPIQRPQAPKELKNIEDNITSIVSTVAPSVVSIIIKKDLVIYRSDPWGFFQQPAGSIERKVGGGSGFFVREDGLILTNKHVIQDKNADYTVILSDGTEYSAEVLSIDPINDLALIRIINTKQNFPVLPIVKKGENIAIGSFAIAIGNALAEFQNSVSLGIVSGKNRSIEAGNTLLSNLIQTDAAINPGNSGGPLLSLDGQVIGINTAIAGGSTGIGFAIALSEERIAYMIESTELYGSIKRPFIGINYIENSQGVAEELGLPVEYGAYIVDEAESIVAGSAADKAGLKPGDIILSVNGEVLTSMRGLASILQDSIPGDILKLRVLTKNGETRDIDLELGSY